MKSGIEEEVSTLRSKILRRKDCEIISQYSGFPVDMVELIKVHLLSRVLSEPVEVQLSILNSWNRLYSRNASVNDFALLSRSRLELLYILEGKPFEESRRLASRRFYYSIQ